MYYFEAKQQTYSPILLFCMGFFSGYLYYYDFSRPFSLDWNHELITEPRPTMEISDGDLMDIGNGTQKLEDFISRIICHSTKNEFAVGKRHA